MSGRASAARRLPAWRLPRPLHPGAWWLWALGLSTAATRTTNPLLLVLLIAVAGYVVGARRTDAPWARAYAVFIKLALAVIVLRVLLQIVFGARVPGRVAFRLPEVPLPGWAAGVHLGGQVTVEALAGALYDGLRLAALLVCVGAANALVAPSRLLRLLPGALYELGVAVTVATTFAPQAVVSAGRIRAARRLRGRPDRGLRSLRGLAVPVLEGALERSLELAASMDSRGYGRRAHVPPGRRRLTAALTVGGLLAVCTGLYGLLDAGSPPALGLPALLAGAGLAAAGLVLGGRRTPRTRYRPDPWALPEWLVAGSGLAAAGALIAAVALGTGGLAPSTAPLVAPGLPALPLAGVLAGLLPAWAAPRPACPPAPSPVAA